MSQGDESVIAQLAKLVGVPEPQMRAELLGDSIAAIGGGGGGGGALSGQYVGEGELKEKAVRKVEPEGATYVFLIAVVHTESSDLHIEIEPESGSGRRIYETSIGADVGTGTYPIGFFVPGGGSWSWQGTNVGKGTGLEFLDFVEFQLTSGGGSGGTSQVKLVDLGVIDFAKVFTEGPQTLYEMQPGEFLRAVKFTDTAFVAPVPRWGLPNSALTAGIGTRKSFGFWSFAAGYQTGEEDRLFDSDGLIAHTPPLGYGPELDELGRTLVLSAAEGGPVEASFFLPAEAHGNGSRAAGIDAWKAKTPYALRGAAKGGGAAPSAAWVIANGTIWQNIGAAGESGAVEPEFAAHAGGEIADGAAIIWQDTTDVPFSAGSQHAVAEIWKP